METLSRLENANFTTEQARAIIAVIEDHQRELATKLDVDSSEKKLETKIDSAKIELRAEILQAKYEVVKWIVGTLILNIGLVVSLMFAMFKFFLDK